MMIDHLRLCGGAASLVGHEARYEKYEKYEKYENKGLVTCICSLHRLYVSGDLEAALCDCE